MTDQPPTPPKKPSVRRERGTVRPAAPTVEALASAVRAAEEAKPARPETPRAEVASKPAAPLPPPVRPEPVRPETPAAEAPKVQPPAPRPVAEAKAAPAPAPVATPAAAAPRPSRGGLMPLVREHGPLAAALAMALGLGWVSGLATMIHATPAEVPPAPAALVMDLGVPAPLAIGTATAETQRLNAELKAVTGAVAALRASLDGARQDQAARLARLEKADAEAAARLQEIAERVAATRDGEAALAPVLERLERIERAALNPPAAIQTASLPAPAAPVAAAPAPVTPPPAPAVTGSLPEARPGIAAPEPRPTEKAAVERAPERLEILAGWHLRGVHRGVALVEGRRGLVEVRAGEMIPGVGRVEAIERRGREWVVVTARGLITTESW